MKRPYWMLWGWVLASALCQVLAAEPDTRAKASPWQTAFNLRPIAGYKDNVLLSSFDEQKSSFVGAEADAFVWRPVGDRSSFQGMFSGEHRQFLEAADVDMEQLFYGLAEMKHDWSDNWESGESLEYVYIDQILDVSATEELVSRARVQGHSIVGRPVLRRRTNHGWVELELSGGRQILREPLDDYWQLAPKVAWEWPEMKNSEITLSYEFSDSWYDNDAALDQTGAPIEGTRREVQQHTVGLLARQYWGGQRQWRMTLGFTGRLNVDPAEGYYDYRRPALNVGLRFRPSRWEFDVRARVSHYAYVTQTVDLDDASRRRRTELRLEASAKRQLLDFLYAFVRYNYEQTFANRPEEAYHVSMVTGGLDFEF